MLKVVHEESEPSATGATATSRNAKLAAIHESKSLIETHDQEPVGIAERSELGRGS
jgi:hypothetical protein